MNKTIDIPIQDEGETATIFAGDYLNKITGEQIERECKMRIDAGFKKLILNFRDTEIVNSIGVSILLGVIDAASDAETSIVFSDVGADTTQLFEMLGLTNHVTLEN